MSLLRDLQNQTHPTSLAGLLVLEVKRLLLGHPERFDSEAIADFKYETSDRVLEVRFNSGATYSYLDVPRSLFTMFKHADSKGRFFQQHIRDKFEYAKLEDSEKGGPGSGNFGHGGHHGVHGGSGEPSKWARSSRFPRDRKPPPGITTLNDLIREQGGPNITQQDVNMGYATPEQFEHQRRVVDSARRIYNSRMSGKTRELFANWWANVEYEAGPEFHRDNPDDMLKNYANDLATIYYDAETKPKTIEDWIDAAGEWFRFEGRFKSKEGCSHAPNHCFTPDECGTLTTTSKGEKCVCGKPAIGFMGDAFLCKKCMMDAMGNVAVPKWVLESKGGPGSGLGNMQTVIIPQGYQRRAKELGFRAEKEAEHCPTCKRPY